MNIKNRNPSALLLRCFFLFPHRLVDWCVAIGFNPNFFALVSHSGFHRSAKILPLLLHFAGALLGVTWHVVTERGMRPTNHVAWPGKILPLERAVGVLWKFTCHLALRIVVAHWCFRQIVFQIFFTSSNKCGRRGCSCCGCRCKAVVTVLSAFVVITVVTVVACPFPLPEKSRLSLLRKMCLLLVHHWRLRLDSSPASPWHRLDALFSFARHRCANHNHDPFRHSDYHGLCGHGVGFGRSDWSYFCCHSNCSCNSYFSLVASSMVVIAAMQGLPGSLSIRQMEALASLPFGVAAGKDDGMSHPRAWPGQAFWHLVAFSLTGGSPLVLLGRLQPGQVLQHRASFSCPGKPFGVTWPFLSWCELFDITWPLLRLHGLSTSWVFWLIVASLSHTESQSNTAATTNQATCPSCCFAAGRHHQHLLTCIMALASHSTSPGPLAIITHSPQCVATTSKRQQHHLALASSEGFINAAGPFRASLGHSIAIAHQRRHGDPASALNAAHPCPRAPGSAINGMTSAPLVGPKTSTELPF